MSMNYCFIKSMSYEKLRGSDKTISDESGENIMWSGNFFIGNSFALYTGARADTNEAHKHVAYQLIHSHSGSVEVTNEFDKIAAQTILIPPLVSHSIHSSSPLTLLYLEPHSYLVERLLKTKRHQSITILDIIDFPIELNQEDKPLIDSLNVLANMSSSNVDRRVLLAMQKLDENPGVVSVAKAANMSGLSESRLRTIVRNQLGISLASWLIWRKLKSAGDELIKGANLIDASIAGGFTDQAHFTRSMKRMFGITPTTALNALR